MLLVVCTPSAGPVGSSPSAAEDLGEGALEFATGAGVDERVEAAVAIAEPEAAGEERRRNAARGTQRLCKAQTKARFMD